MEFAELRARAAAFGDELARVKAATPPPAYGTWYPRMLPGHIELLDRLLVGEHRALLERPTARRVADIGAADGDLGFFLETVGFDVDLFDVADRPAVLKAALGARAGTHSVDLDRVVVLPTTYDLVFLLHVVYHLRNPVLALEGLTRWTPYVVLSTRVSNRLGPGGRWRRDVRDWPVAYLLDPFELNPRDPHNYWIFTEAGLFRLVDRCGWDLLNHIVVGDPSAGPADRDQPVYWCLLRRRETPPGSG